MMFGHVETLAERIEHLERLRRLQDETGGFTAFICWTFQPDHTDMAHIPAAGSFDYLKTQAVGRLYLDNFANIQSSWVTQGRKIGQIALTFGANDMGSLMIEENVVAEAGTVHFLTLDEIREAIEEIGYTPRQRNVMYELFGEEREQAAVSANRTRVQAIRSECEPVSRTMDQAAYWNRFQSFRCRLYPATAQPDLFRRKCGACNHRQFRSSILPVIRARSMRVAEILTKIKIGPAARKRKFLGCLLRRQFCS